jgi:hypothetical protein
MLPYFICSVELHMNVYQHITWDSFIRILFSDLCVEKKIRWCTIFGALITCFEVLLYSLG